MSPRNRNRQTQVAGIFVAVFATITILGWLTNKSELTTLGIPGNVTMKMNTAIGLLLAALALIGLSFPGNRYYKPGILASSIISLIGFVTLLQYATGSNFGIDTFFTDDQITKPGIPGRMSPVTALNLSLTGIALLLMYLKRLQQVVQLISIIIFTFSVLIIVSYAFKLNYRTTIPFFNSMAVQTASIFVVLGLSIFSAPALFTPKFPFEGKLLASIGFIILIMLTSYYLINKSNEDFIASGNEVEHTRDVIFEAEQIKSSCKDIELSARAFTITDDSFYIKRYTTAVDSTIRDIAVLKRLTADNPAQQKRIEQLENIFQKELEAGTTLLTPKTFEGKEFVDNVTRIIADIEQSENAALARRKEIYSTKINDSKRVGLVFVGMALSMLVIIYLLVQSNQLARNRAEAELKESEEWFATTLSSIGEGVIVTDKNQEVIFMNPVARALTKWGKEAYGKTIDEVFPTIHEKSRTELENPIKEALRDKKIVAVSNHAILVRKDKTEINIDDSAAPIIDDDGNITGVVLVFRDVTEQKKIDRVLKTNSLMLQSISDAVIGTDKNFIITNVNKNTIDLYGYKDEDLVGHRIDEKLQISFGSAEKSVVRESFLKNKSWTGELKTKDAQGNEKDVLVSSSIIVDEYGETQGSINIHKDITDRKRREEENKYNSILLENISDAIISTDTAFTIRTWNQAAADMYGYSSYEAVGRSLGDLLKVKVTEDARDKALAKLHEVNFFRDEYEVASKSGEIITILASVNVIRNKEGEITGYVAAHKNITERKKAQERINYLALLVEQTSDAIFSIDNDSKIISWNQGAEQMYGYPRNEVIGKNAREITQTAYTKEEFEQIKLSIEKYGRWSGDGIHKDRAGNTMNVYTSISPIRNGNNEDQGAVLIVKNITEKKKLEEQLKNFNTELQKQVAEKTAEIKEIFDRVNDGFIAFDRKWNFNFVNKKAGEIYRLPPDQLVGKNVWELFSSAIGSPFHSACLKAMETQEYVFVESFSDIFEYWYESHLYPSEAGLSVYFKDVTEKKKAEQLLVTSEETRKLIIDSAMDAIICADTDGNITVWNPQAEKIFGWTSSEVLGKQFANTIFPERFTRQIVDAMENKKNAEQETILKKLLEGYAKNKSGTEFPVEISIIPISDKGPGFYCAFVRDITERKKIQDAILREKDFSEKIIDSLPGVFYLFDKHGKFLWWNKHLENVSDYRHDEIANMHPADFFGSRVRQDVIEKMEEVLKHGSSESEGYLRTKSGNKIPFYFTGTYVNYNGQPCLLGTGIDISERKKAEIKLIEERMLLRTLIDNLPDYIYVKDRELRHVINNKANVELLGAKSEEDTLGKTAFDYFDKDIAADFIKDDQLVFENKEPIINREELIINHQGETRWLLTTKVPILNNQQEVSMIVGISRDITDRKKAEKILESSIERFEMIGKTTNDAVWEWDMETDEHWANEMHQKLYGLSDTEKIPDYDEWKSRLHPEDSSQILKSLENTLQSKSNAWIAEYRFYRGKDKKECINVYDRTYIVRKSDGSPLRMMGSMVDITARKTAEENLKRNEEKYRLLFASSPLPMWVYDIETFKILDVNEAAIKQYGYEKSEFLNMTIKDLRPEEDVEKLVQSTRIVNPGVRQTGTWRHIKKDGSIIDVEINSHDIFYNERMSRLVLSNDITEKLKSQKIIIEASEQLRNLSARLQEIREEERMHMAHEIHDELGQRLTVLKMDISWLKRYLKEADLATREKLEGTLELLDGTIKIVRRIATDLRPGILDDLGLIAALEWQSKDFENRSGIEVSFKSNISEIALSSELATGLFRIYQESLTNVGRHAEASQISSTLVREENLISLSIKDDGKGFDMSTLGTKKTLGITGMKERTVILGGEYIISSKPGKGTTITVKVPLPKD